MMALSVEEKDRRKAAQKIRNQGYRDRCILRDYAEQTGLAEIEASGLPALMDAANTASEAIRERRREAVQESARKIAAIKAELAEIETQINAEYVAARSVESELWKRKNDAELALQQRLDAQFPDLVGPARWSAAAWNPAKVSS